jgi:predicted dehydrogenase
VIERPLSNEHPMPNNTEPLTVAVIGAGARSRSYCNHALKHPERMKVVAVAEPDAERRNHFADMHQVPPEMRFADYRELAKRPRLAEAVVNGTMDDLHYESSMPMIEKGYHLLLEKPIAPTQREVCDLIDATRRRGVTVMICHVLRYAPFYRQIKNLLDEGRIGQVVALRTSECVSYHHMATAFVRGKWNRSETSNPILLAKCCHDLDIIAWLMSGLAVRKVASFGSLSMFRPENAPAGAADRCLAGCEVEATCPYSARRLYVDASFGFSYPWGMFTEPAKLTREQKLESLRQDNPYGRCVWRCDNNVYDHQNVIVEFANGATATHDLFCGTARPTRTIHLMGDVGEIVGDFETGVVQARTFDPASTEPRGYREQVIDTKATGGGGQGGHGGGDGGLIEDFVRTLRGSQPSPGATRIEDSLTGHIIGFAADESVRTGKVIELTGR